MKPNDTILNTDFYQLANDGGLELSLSIPSGTVADYWTGAVFASQTFSVGSALADYDGLIFDSKNNSWAAGTTKALEINGETVFDGISTGIIPTQIEVKYWRNSGNSFTVTVAASGLGGMGEMSPRPTYLIYLRENLQIKLRIKTFLQPEL